MSCFVLRGGNKMVSKTSHNSCLHGAYSLMGKTLNNYMHIWCYEILQIGETGFIRLGDFCLRTYHLNWHLKVKQELTRQWGEGRTFQATQTACEKILLEKKRWWAGRTLKEASWRAANKVHPGVWWTWVVGWSRMGGERTFSIGLWVNGHGTAVSPCWRHRALMQGRSWHHHAGRLD